ncbi:tetratricopeptide repeat protein [Porphyromonas endodontalis]|uniref:tetratricopeptide repeat protein n=1 Tax=Porphyromonas endodontalis TaxID=28124 RepID=UPI0028E90BDC|nr:tetratricopeptide repeat protein [Porphyromonas endodontalis]
MIEIPPGLREAIKADELVLFVGAGLSWNFKNKKNETLEGWTKMASSITSHLKEKHRITEEVKQSCDKKEPIDALKEIEDSGVNKRIVGEFVKDYFTLGEGNDYSLHQNLFELSTKIITTNYDRAFEMAVPRLQEIKAYRGKDYELNRLKKDSIFLFKLHGCIENVDSMVLFPSDYEKLYNSKGRDAEHALYALRNHIFNKTFLFIGTGLSDPQINSFFEEIKRIQQIYNQEHYIITPDPLEKSLDFLTRIPIPSYEEIPGIIDQLLEIKRAQDEKNIPLNEQLKETEKRNEVLTKELEEVKDKNERNLLLLEWESNNRFNRGLKYHLAGEYLEALEEYEVATILNPRNSEAFCNWGTALSDLAKTKSGSEAEKLYHEAFEKYQETIEYKPDYYEAYNKWGIALSDLAETKSGSEAEELYDEAFERYRQATAYKPDYYAAHNNWGNALYALAKTKSGSEAEELYNEAIDKYQGAIKYKLDYHEAYYNWGVALMELARTKSSSEAEDLYNEAIDKYQEAIMYRSDNPEAYNNWGVALMELARTKSGSEAEDLYKEAIDKYREAVKYRSDYHGAYYNWGNVLIYLAQIKSDSEAEDLYNEAIDKYREAVKYRSDYHAAYNNWGNTLIYLAQIKSDSEAENLYDEAIEKYLQAIEYGGDSFYNLACLYVLRNRKEETLKYLDHALSRGEVSVEILESRWIWLRDDPDFKRLLSQYKGK